MDTNKTLGGPSNNNQAEDTKQQASLIAKSGNVWWNKATRGFSNINQAIPDDNAPRDLSCKNSAMLEDSKEQETPVGKNQAMFEGTKQKKGIL